MTDSFLTKLNQCRRKVKLQSRTGQKIPELNRYDLWRQKFSARDLKTNPAKKLTQAYTNRLLVPLFQTNPLYAKINRVAGNARFTPQVCRDDFAEKITGKNPDTTFILLVEFQEKLVGDISVFAINPVKLFETKLKAGAVGVMTEDLIEVKSGFPSQFNNLKCAYFNGIGVAENYQNLGIGVYLLYRAVKELEQRNFDVLITRVMKQANNYRLMKRLSNKVVLTYSNPKFGQNYRIVFISMIKNMRYKLEEEMKRKFINFKELL